VRPAQAETEARFLALIPARLASTRLPDKPLADLGGRPMIVRVAERAARSGAHRVAVATDSERIASAVRDAGFEALMTGAEHPSGTDRLAEAACLLNLADDEIVVNVQGDEPLIPPALIRAVAGTLENSPGCAMATAAHPIRSLHDFNSPHVVKVVTDRWGRALYFSRSAIPFEREVGAGPGSEMNDSQADPKVSERLSAAGLPMRHIGLYAYRAGFLKRFPALEPAPIEALESLEQLRVLWHGEAIAVHLSPEAPPGGVDTPEDLARVRQYWLQFPQTPAGDPLDRS
jgi:3-deoxy-manno-octulosonate cytidylyltransferase (CMP-KDO synthetase)